MKVFVTGGSGFIGQHVVRKLVSRGHQVYALARSEQSAAIIRQLGAVAVPGDITDRDSMRESMQGAGLVFHIAALYSFAPDARQLAEALNVAGTRNVLELAYELGVPRIIYTSTVAVFGDTHGDLVDESYVGPMPEATAYERTKWKAHYEVALPLIKKGAPIIIVMPGAAYGPGDPSWLGELMRLYYRGQLPAVPGPETTVTFAHVEDIAEGHLLAAEKGRIGESYILAGPAVPLGEMVDFWSHLTGRSAPSTHIPARYLKGLAPVAGRIQPALSLPTVFSDELVSILGTTYMARSDKARSELGWATRPLQTGMTETFRWLAATQPAPSGLGNKKAARIALLAAAGLLLLWLLRRNDQRP